MSPRSRSFYQDLAKKSGDEREFNFFTASTIGGRLAERVRNDCKQGESCENRANLVMMDIQDNLAYYEFPGVLQIGGEVSKANVEQFLADFKAGKLEKKSMRGDDE